MKSPCLKNNSHRTSE